MPADSKPFWEGRSLTELTAEEWESLCDGCGRCCLVKLEDEDTGQLYYTNVACRFLDLQECRCTVYPERTRHASDCVDLTAEVVESIDWLPSTCAYRRIHLGDPLPAWHPLVCGDPQGAKKAGVAVCGHVISEDERDEESSWEDYILGKPL